MIVFSLVGRHGIDGTYAVIGIFSTIVKALQCESEYKNEYRYLDIKGHYVDAPHRRITGPAKMYTVTQEVQDDE